MLTKHTEQTRCGTKITARAVYKHPMLIKSTLALLFYIFILHSQSFASNTIITQPEKLIGFKHRDIPSLNANDVRLLQPVCVLVLGNGMNNKIWYDVLKNNPILDHPLYNMAKGAISLHHYCYGEAIKIKRPSLKTNYERKFAATAMMTEYKFVIDHDEWRPTNWPYLKNVFVEYGKAALLADNTGEAVRAFFKALQLDPGYDQAHFGLIDVYRRSNAKDQILKQATEALRHNPQSKALKRIYIEYGGKEPYPEPYAKPSVSTNNMIEGAIARKQIEVQNPQTFAPPSATPNHHLESDSTATTTPKNQFCRFCP